jgi:hypothetical protein
MSAPDVAAAGARVNAMPRAVSLQSALWLVVALIPFAIVSAVRWSDRPGEGAGDYAHYLLHAKALAEGRPYADIGYIHTDLNLVGPRTQPPGWPIVLAPIVGVFGVNSPVIKVVVTLLVAAFGLLAGLYVRRRDGPVAGVCVAMMVPLVLETTRATSTPISDPLACALIWSALVLADGELRSWRRLAAVVALALYAVLVRVAAVALIPAILLLVITQYRRLSPRVVWPLMGGGVVAVAVLIFFAGYLPGVGDFVAGTHLTKFDLVQTFRTYRYAMAAAVLYPLPAGGGNEYWQALVALPVVIGALLFVTRQVGTPAWWFLFTYGGLLLVSPLREPRYAWPLTPLIVLWLVTGLTAIAEWVRQLSGWRYRLQPAVPVFLVVVSLAAAYQLVRAPAPPSLQGNPPTEALFEEIRRLRSADGSGPRVAFANPRVLSLLTGVSAMGLPNANDDTVMEEFEVKRITHVVLPLHSRTLRSETVLERVLTARASRFELVYRNERYEMYRLVDPVTRGE